MSRSDTEVIVIGGGAAGVAAARRLHEAGIRCLILEARARLGGRAWTVIDGSGVALDLGCGWLHSADRNAWADIALEQGRAIDKTPPPWERPSLESCFPRDEQLDFLSAQHAFDQRLDGTAENGPDQPASAFLEAGGRWNALMDAVSTYYSGAELDRLSAHDLARYQDSGVNWRVVDGYGATVGAYGADLSVALECPVRRIDHSGKRLSIETAQGSVSADQVIVALPTSILTDGTLFSPALPGKAEAAAGLPLGLANKLFLSLDRAEEFESDSRLFGRTDRTGTGSYHIRPLGRPIIEAYFGGQLAWDLEAQGEHAFHDFAVSELGGALGSTFARRLKPIKVHRWGADPFSRGSYSYALPGKADCRAILAEPVDDRLFFAGEACSPRDFSTTHGALQSGRAAADQVITARNRLA
jgi:monoamine oxidase